MLGENEKQRIIKTDNRTLPTQPRSAGVWPPSSQVHTQVVEKERHLLQMKQMAPRSWSHSVDDYDISGIKDEDREKAQASFYLGITKHIVGFHQSNNGVHFFPLFEFPLSFAMLN